MYRVQLTPGEIAACKMFAQMRTYANIGAGVKDLRISQNSNHDISEDGVIGEFAFCKYHNVFLNFDCTPRSGGVDCYFKGKRIDVKTIRYPNGHLTTGLKKNMDIDYFVLGIYNHEALTVDFVGYTTPAVLYQDHNIKRLKPHLGEGYVLAQSELFRFQDQTLKVA